MHVLSNFRFCPCCGAPEFEENDYRSKVCKQCGFSFYLNAATAVVAIILNERNELLLCTRKYDPCKGSADLPGGFVEFDETAEDALKREVMEELGGELVSAEYFITRPNIYPCYNIDVHTLDIAFICTLKDTNNLCAGDDVADYRFVPLADVDTDLIKLQSIKSIVEMFLKKKIKS